MTNKELEQVFIDFCTTSYLKASIEAVRPKLSDAKEMLERWVEVKEMIAFHRLQLANTVQHLAKTVKSHKKYPQINAHWSDIRNPVERMTRDYAELDHWESENRFIRDMITSWVASENGFPTLHDN